MAFVGKTFAIWAIPFAVLGFFLPEIFKQFAPSIVTRLGIIMFCMGLKPRQRPPSAERVDLGFEVKVR